MGIRYLMNKFIKYHYIIPEMQTESVLSGIKREELESRY